MASNFNFSGSDVFSRMRPSGRMDFSAVHACNTRATSGGSATGWWGDSWKMHASVSDSLLIARSPRAVVTWLLCWGWCPHLIGHTADCNVQYLSFLRCLLMVMMQWCPLENVEAFNIKNVIPDVIFVMWYFISRCLTLYFNICPKVFYMILQFWELFYSSGSGRHRCHSEIVCIFHGFRLFKFTYYVVDWLYFMLKTNLEHTIYNHTQCIKIHFQY
jgi:hypothetical protein